MCWREGGDEAQLYKAAVDVLAAAACASRRPAQLAPDKPLHAYDETALLAETDLMTEWFLPLALGRAATRGRNRRASRAVARRAGQHRRRHAACLCIATIMRRTCSGCRSATALARVGLIDFQDAVAGIARL